MTVPRYLLAEQLAQLLGVTESTVRRRYQAGSIPGEPLGKNSVLFVRDDLIEAGVLEEEGKVVSCAECGSELGVRGDATLEHQDDGSHIVSPALAEEADA